MSLSQRCTCVTSTTVVTSVAVALHHDGSGTVELADRVDHLLEVGDRRVTDLDDRVAGLDACPRRRTAAVTVIRLVFDEIGGDTRRLADDRWGLRAGSEAPR